MNRTIRFTGLVLASLTISTVAMAQQGGGGRGGDGGGGDGGGGDSSILQLLHEDAARKARLTRAVEPRRGAGSNCSTRACNEPPIRLDNGCTGKEVFVHRGRDGQVIRAFCETR